MKVNGISLEMNEQEVVALHGLAISRREWTSNYLSKGVTLQVGYVGDLTGEWTVFSVEGNEFTLNSNTLFKVGDNVEHVVEAMGAPSTVDSTNQTVLAYLKATQHVIIYTQEGAVRSILMKKPGLSRTDWKVGKRMS